MPVFLPLVLVQRQMMSNYDDKDNIHAEMERPCEMLIDRSIMELDQTTHKNKPRDSDFSMNPYPALIAFTRAMSVGDPDTTSIADVAEDGEMASLVQSDPYPWMRCCGRNFKHSVFSLQPSRAPKRGLGRHRRGLAREQRGQPPP